MFSLDWLLVIFVLLMENLDATLLGSRTSRQTAGQTVHAWVSAPERHVWGLQYTVPPVRSVVPRDVSRSVAARCGTPVK